MIGGFGAIDPGKRGAIVAMAPDRRILLALATDEHFITAGGLYSEGAMFDALAQIKAFGVYVVIEQQQSYPDDSPQSSFTTGYGYALWIMGLRAHGIRYAVKHPLTWQAAMLPKGVNTKKAAAQLCAARLPTLDIARPNLKLRFHDGLADGGAICLYGQSLYGSVPAGISPPSLQVSP